jgi:nitrite reductase (cytochrome c-552)
MKPIKDQIQNKPWLGWLLFFGSMILVFMLGLLASSIIERRAETVFAYAPKVKLSAFEPRNEVWGENFPKQFQSYYQTADTSFRSKHGGNAVVDMLENYPDLVILWAGYPFSKDYKQGRGHYYAVEDVRNTLRTGAPIGDTKSPLPNTCWTCKSPDVPRLMNEMGIAEFYKGSWEKLGNQVVNTIGCADCHDPVTMNLRISRPALIEAYERQGKDISKATHQEMRSLVCAQCHVEYYFDKKKIADVPYLTFPWDKGSDMESMEKYYDEIEFSDWTHALSKTPMIKAQHPDYEVFTKGIHYQRGVACADCHMPYANEGGQKYTHHKIQSPLNHISKSCQVCHRESEEELRNNVYERQDKIKEIRSKLEHLLVQNHIEAKAAWDAGASEEEMKIVLKLIRQAQWRWDFAAAGHGNAFHAPLETARVITTGIDKSHEARFELHKILTAHNVKTPVALPDVSTKSKAQEYIGLDMPKLTSEKNEFIKTVVPKWLEEAKERENKYPKTIL